MDIGKRRLVHPIEFLKDPYDFCEFVIALLSLNVSIDKISMVSNPKQRNTLKVFDQVESKLA